jgi:hypothetical protein
MPETEAAMWAALEPRQRAKATQRMSALTRWLEADGEIDVKIAAADAGVSVTRMYEMGKAWRERRSLASLGTFAGAPKTRVNRHERALAKTAAAVVADDPSGSVRKLALALQAACGLPDEEMPSHNTLRRYVADELRRREQQAKAGDDIQLDCAACTLRPSDTAVETVFVIMDRWTQVVLGAALGNIEQSRSGYALAARDATRRLAAGQFDGLPWVSRLSRVEAVTGSDEPKWSGIRAEFERGGIAAPIELSTRPDRFGRYLRQLTGLRIGTVVILPKRTLQRQAGGQLKPEGGAMDDQVARLAVEVDEYNAKLVATYATMDKCEPPEDLIRFLKLLSSD